MSRVDFSVSRSHFVNNSRLPRNSWQFGTSNNRVILGLLTSTKWRKYWPVPAAATILSPFYRHRQSGGKKNTLLHPLRPSKIAGAHMEKTTKKSTCWSRPSIWMGTTCPHPYDVQICALQRAIIAICNKYISVVIVIAMSVDNYNNHHTLKQSNLALEVA